MMYELSMKIFPYFIYFCSLYTFSSLCQFCSAVDYLSANSSISDGQTLVSPGGRFELGFSSPGRSKSKYFGVWYKSTPDVFVWVANRNDPMFDSQDDGILFLSGNGSLVVRDGSRRVYWEANVSRVAVRPIVRLLDTGNLVLIDEAGQDSGNNGLWQSFDYPTNTRLPGMQMGLNLETGRNQHLTTWKTDDDPSPGKFSYGMETVGLSQLVLRMGNQTRWRTGPWNGISFNGFVLLGQNGRLPFSVIQGPDGTWAASMSDPYNSSVFTRMVLNETGVLQRYYLDVKKNEWMHTYTVPEIPCEAYGTCGPNSICNPKVSPLCKCLEGFTENSTKESEGSGQVSGCSRHMTTEHCQKGETFLKYPGVKFPDLLRFQLEPLMNRSQCAEECLRNCSCTAYANPFMNSVDTGCLFWYGDLLDILQFPEEYNEQYIYVRVAISPVEKISNVKNKKNKARAKIIWILAASTSLITLLFVGCIYMKIKSKRKEMEKRKEEELELPIFEFATVAQATNNFSNVNKIGQGGFGPVYKGKLMTGREVAVKRLSKTSGQGIEEFKNEVMFIAKLQHRNLVRLIGCCIRGEERMLIYEYLQNNSLHQFIFSPEKSATLTWQKRLEIIEGITRGLVYLHQDSRLKIIHRDLKASNILLDNDLVPKISDFGLARLFDGDQPFAITRRVVGTFGYMAPEYAIDGHFSVKSDVFSLGVMLLEIVSGKKNRCFSHADHNLNLLGHSWLLWKDNRALELMDECLKDSYVDSEVKRCVQVGLLCVQKLAEDRPSMPSVLFMLGNEGATLPHPKQPGFFIERSSTNQNINSSEIVESNNSTTGEISMITLIEAR